LTMTPVPGASPSRLSLSLMSVQPWAELLDLLLAAGDDIGIAAVGESPLLAIVPRRRMADLQPAHSLRWGRLNSASTIASIAMPRCSTLSTAAAIGISTPRLA